MIYILDSNVLIDANRDYYSITRVPEFWDWLVYKGGLRELKIPVEIFEELKSGNDDLSTWAKMAVTSDTLVLDENVDIGLVQKVLREGYAADLTDAEVQRLGRDPFLIAYALSDINGRCVVTTENSKPNRQRANRHVPDVCDTFGIPWCHAFELYSALGFSTHWSEDLQRESS